MFYPFSLLYSEKQLIRHNEGFTLTELLITMAVLVLVLSAASEVFTGLLTNFKQQGKIAESNMEGNVGLEMMRRDLGHAGYGLPWSFQNSIHYSEASGHLARNYNDAPGSPPRAFVSGNNAGPNGSDYLAIKATNVARNKTCDKWTVLGPLPFVAPYNPRSWIPQTENLAKSDRVIIIAPGDTGFSRSLVMSAEVFSTNYGSIMNSPWPPSETAGTRIVYGVDPDTALRMPFNRADYFISQANVPKKCAPNTGVLEKAIINQGNGGQSFLPILDCVADFQVIYRLDMDGDGAAETESDADGSIVLSADGNANAASVMSTFQNAADLRRRLREIRVYILAHEGQKDAHYGYPENTITVGEYGLGSLFKLNEKIGTEWKHYRWRVYSIIVKPGNLRG